MGKQTAAASGPMLREGKDYVARAKLWNKAGVIVAEPGETCERVPAESLWWLVEQGYIALQESDAKEGR
jgi:hypothetical protein